MMKTREEWKKYFDEKITKEQYLVECEGDRLTKAISTAEMPMGPAAPGWPHNLQCDLQCNCADCNQRRAAVMSAAVMSAAVMSARLF